MVNVTEEKAIWIGSIAVFLLLTLFPFTATNQGILGVIQQRDVSTTIWMLTDELPLLNGFIILLLLNAVVAILKIETFFKARLLLVLNLLAIVLFIVQFVFITPEIPLGSGSFVIFFAFLFILAKAISRLRVIPGDAFISGSVLGIWVLLIIFILFPLLIILTKSVMVEGTVRPSNFAHTLRDYPSTWRILKNSVFMAFSVGVLATAVGLIFALVIERSRVRFKRYLQGFSLLPIITPPFVIGLAIIFMFGRSGFITNSVLGMRTSAIFGYPGIVLAQSLSFAPIAYLILSGVVRSLDTALEEASYTLGADRWYTFRSVIWPLLRSGIANAFLLSVIESLADFANPILLGGDFDVLATSIYLAIIGRYDEGLAACLAVILLGFTLTTFVIQRHWVGKRSYVTITGKPTRYHPIALPKALDYGLVVFTLIWAALTIVLYGSVFIGGFLKLWGINNTFTLLHYKRFLSDGFESYITTLKLAAISAPLTAVLGLLIAYLVSRFQFFARRSFEFTSMLSFAIPGTVIGIGYVMSFNTPPLVFTGTATILIICFIFRNMPVGIRSGMAALQQIDPSLEEASTTLGASNLRTLHRIVIPLIRPALFSGLVFSFVRAMTAISAVIFLVTARTKLATTVILGRIEAGKLGLATAYCTILILTMIAAITLMHLILRSMEGAMMQRVHTGELEAASL
ncbi:MAG: iron ABC transporter permease [Deltaproteobacteria bacterium]|nr:iron ABC transporter permease [Deltaproteobacteria bacterium]